MLKSIALFFSKLGTHINYAVYGNSSLDNTNLRFLLTVYFWGGICGMGAAISNFFLELDPYLTYSAVGMAVLFLGIHRSLFKEWIGFLAGVRLFYVTTLFYFNSMWFVNAGLDGGILIFFYLLVIVIMIYSQGWERFSYLCLVMFNVSLLLYLDYTFEDWSQPFPGRLERYMDVWFSVIISFIVNYIAISVVLKALNRSNSQLADKYKTISKDVDLASKIQQAIMSYDSKDTAFEIATIYKPVSGVGGDIYSIDDISPRKIRLFLADATGHGVQAGLVTMLILSEYLKKKLEVTDPGELIGDLNQAFIQHYSEIRAIFTCIVLDWDLENGEVRYASAGHISQLLTHKHEIFNLEKTGPIVGLKNNAIYRTNRIPCGLDSRVFLFSDGITEAFNSEKKMFGEDRVSRILKDSPLDESIHSTVERMVVQATEFVDGCAFQDDLTVLGISPKQV